MVLAASEINAKTSGINAKTNLVCKTFQSSQDKQEVNIDCA
jgi:hypothetical protein